MVGVADGVIKVRSPNQSKVEVAFEHLGDAEQKMVRNTGASKFKEMGVEANSEGFKGLAVPDEVNDASLTASAMSTYTIVAHIKSVDKVISPRTECHVEEEPPFVLR
jgi:hypothetical protein